MTWGLQDVRVDRRTGTCLDGITIHVEPGTVTAVVGGDGSGKSTLLNVMTGLVVPTAGQVHRPNLRDIGIMAAVPGVWSDLTVDEHVQFTADAYDLDAATSDGVAAALLDRAGLAAARGRLGGDLSGGMRQKLAVVLALLHGPDMLVLDEPTTGVDPVSRAELWRLVGHAAASGTAVLMSTTYLDEAERANDVLVLDHGRPLLQGAPWDVTGDRRLEDVVIDAQLRAESMGGVG